MSADTFYAKLACALLLEQLMMSSAGLTTVHVGIGCWRGIPEGPVISCGVAGGLVHSTKIGSLISANHVVNEKNQTLWEGQPIKISGATIGKIVSVKSIRNSQKSRKALYENTGAIAVETESHALAGPMYKGCVRTISDTPEWPLIFSLYGGTIALYQLGKLRFES